MDLSAGTSHILDRQEAGSYRGNSHQEIVGNDFYIGTNLMNQFEQGQSVEGANGMIGDDHYPTGCWDILALPVREGVGKVEILEDLFNEFDAMEIGILTLKLKKCLFVQHSLENKTNDGGKKLTFIEIRVMLFEYIVDGKHRPPRLESRVSYHCTNGELELLYLNEIIIFLESLND
jgi:hypothetical protein